MDKRVPVIVPDDEIDSIVINIDTGECVVRWKKSKRDQTGIAIELVYGSQGTWARIAIDGESDKTLCVSQSGNMPPVCFYYAETPIIPEDHPIIISEEELQGEFVITQEGDIVG